jgi:hypothetical protein
MSRPPGAARTGTWIAGVACLLALTYIVLNTLGTDAPGSKGLKEGEKMPPFAVPLATAPGPDDTDANVATKPGEGNAHHRACDVRGPGVLNSCELTARGPVVLAFFATGDRRCVREVDVLDRLAPRFPGVSFAAVAIKAKRAQTAAVVRRQGWRVPVGFDHDAAVTNLYAVAICPLVTFARSGGVVTETALGFQDAAAVARRVQALER